jgi:hypothetical protein
VAEIGIAAALPGDLAGLDRPDRRHEAPRDPSARLARSQPMSGVNLVVGRRPAVPA